MALDRVIGMSGRIGYDSGVDQFQTISIGCHMSSVARRMVATI